MVDLRQNRIPIMMSDAELAAVDDWRFANRLGSRAMAIRQLVAKGIEVERGNLESSKPYQFTLRLPDGMRERIAQAAKKSNQSMHEWIISRLALSLQIEREAKGKDAQ